MFRIGCFPYLNAAPLVEGLEGMIWRPPSALVPLLASGRLDAAFVPVVEVLRRGWGHVPGIAIASPGRTDSVFLHHAVEVPKIRRVALDLNSRTTNMLCPIILERRYGLRPEFVVRDPSRRLSLKGVDAAVTIGDTSFRPGPYPVLDLGAEWRALTGRPFVFALWAFRKGHPEAAAIGRMLRKAKSRGVARIEEIATREAERRGLCPEFCRTYLTERITYDLGPAEREGMRLFAEYGGFGS